MPISYQHAEVSTATPQQTFALIDDLPATADWLPPCIRLHKLGEGPNAPGDTLRYVFKEGGRESEMSGEIIARVPNECLICRYSDPSFDVLVDLRITAASTGSCTTHTIEITPKTLFGKLMAPLIRLGLRKQTKDAAANLKRLLEQKPH